MLATAEMSDVAVEGVRFRVARAGAKGRTPALLLHGVPQTSLVWRDLMPDLAADRPVTAPDLKGLGASEISGPYDIPTLVRELAALALHEFDGPVDVVGHDWGGILGLALAGRRPDLVRRLVVVSAPHRHVDYRRAIHVPLLALPLLPEVAFGLGGRSLVRAMIESCWRSATPLDRDLLGRYTMAYADPARRSAMLGYYRAAVRGRLRGGPRSNGRPRPERALVVWGAADPVVPLRVGEAVVRDLGPAASLLVVPDVGHWPVEEAPEVVRAALRDFLDAD